MNIVRYEPWNLLQQFRDDINSLFNDRQPLSNAESDGSSVVTSHWVPAVDIKEDQDQFVLTADLPGIDPKNIEITMENGVLTLKGERQWSDQQEKNGYRRVERVRGTFYRRFSLPDTANAEGIAAKGNNGVLTVTIPKQEKAQPRRIEVA